MAAVTFLDVLMNTNSGTKTRVGAVTPAVGNLIVLVTVHTGNTSDAAPTDNNADGLGTYTAVSTQLKNTSADKMKFWVRDALIGSATSTTFTHAPGASSGGGLAMYQVTGMTKVGASAVRQVGGEDDQAGGGTPAPVFPGSAVGTNPVISAVFNGTNGAGPADPSGFTELHSNAYGTPATGLKTVADDTGFAGTTVTWGGTSASAFCSVVIELDASAAGAPAPSVTENITISDVVKLNVLLMPKVTDAVTASETIKMNLLLNPRQTDAVTVSDTAKMNLLLNPKVTDTVTVSETERVSITIRINQTDSLSVSDASTVTLAAFGAISISVTDDLTVSDTASVSVTMRIQQTDIVGVSDTANVVGPSAGASISVSVTDAVTVSDIVEMNLLLMPKVSDSITVSDTIQLNVILNPQVEDIVTVADTSTTRIVVMPNVSDAIIVSDTVKMNLLLMPAVMDLLSVSDLGTVQIVSPMSPVLVIDLVIVSDSAIVRIGGGRGKTSLLPIMLVG